MNERDQAWANYPEDNDLAHDHWNAGYDAGRAAAVDKYMPALSAAEAERDLARQAAARWDRNELTITTISAAHSEYCSNGDLHELARAIGQILYGPDDMLPENARTTVERPQEDDE